MDDQNNIIQETQTEPNERINKENILAYSNPIKPTNSKKPIIFIAIIFFLVVLSISSYAYFSTGNKSSNKSEQVNISPTIVLVPTTTNNAPTMILSPSTTPTPTAKKQVFPTATKTPAPTPTPTPFDTEAPSSYYLTYTTDTGGGGPYPNVRNDGSICIGLSPPRDNYYSSYDLETRFRFDEGEWSSYSKKLAQACKVLPLGQHTIEIQTRDPSGNVENPPKKYTFTATEENYVDY